ncbi:MAG: glycosyl transferase [Cyanobacteria bacterium RYN_339]|nr:glycosyl transferase [Cyanobacteria bacterium RYN_339]
MIIAGYVTVIVPVHDGALSIRRCLEAIAAQTYRPLEVVVVDDGSTDPTPAWVRSFRAAHPEILVQLVPQQRAGTGAALAAGLEKARGEFIALAHQADVWEPTKLARQVSRLQGAPDAAYCLAGVVEQVGGWHRARTAARVDCWPLCQGIALSSLVARRRAIEAVGGFDPEPGLAVAHELACRLARHGRGVRLAEVLAVCHRAPRHAMPALAASLEKLARTGRLRPEELKRGRGRVHASEGWQALLDDEPVAARQRFREALADDPRLPTAWLGLAFAALDRALFASGLLRPAAR